MSTIVTQDYSDPDGICECYWRNNRCLNKAEYIIKCLSNNGFSIMCEVHKDQYIERDIYTDNSGLYRIEWYSLEQTKAYLDILKTSGPYGDLDKIT